MNKKQPLSDSSFNELIEDAKSNSGIYKEFQEKAKDTHQMLAHEFALHLGFYTDYTSIFTPDKQLSLDLVQNAFIRALEYPEDFDVYHTQGRDPKSIILSYIQEDLEKNKNPLFLITKQFLENHEDEFSASPTPLEAVHEKEISEEIAKTFDTLNESEKKQVLDYMLDSTVEKPPEEILEKFQKNENLRTLYNTPDSSNDPT